MPLPEINNKDKSTFMQECVSMVVNEGTPQEQAVEMCLNKWREATDERLEPKPLSPLDKILKIKKAMEKIGCFIDESPLEEFISKIRIQKNASLENMAKDVVFLEALGNIIKLQTHDIKPTDEAQKILAFPKGTFYIEI